MNRMIAFASILLGCSGVALADIPIKEYDSEGHLLTPVQSVSGTADVQVTLKPDTRFVDILPPDNSTTIPRITFVGGPDYGVVSFYLGSDESTTGPDFVNQDVAPVKKGGTFKGIAATGLGDGNDANGFPISQFYGGIAGDFGIKDDNENDGTFEDHFYIHVDRLVRFDVGGSVIGDFEVDSAGGTGETPVFVIEGGGFSNTCEIRLTNGSIKRIKAVDDMKAEIEVQNGDINLIDAGGKITGYAPSPIFAWRGKIGTITFGTYLSQNPANNTGGQPMIRANEGIDYILYKYPSGAAREDGYINAYIVANDTTYDTTVTDGSIRKIDCFALYNFSQPDPNMHTRIIASKFKKDGSNSGIFIGTGAQDALLKATGNAESEIIFGGDVLANGTSPAIEIVGSLIDDTTLDGSLVIGGSLAGKVKLGAQGLKGQVIINANDASETWTGDVVIGSTTISTSTSGFPYYNITSAALGGGAIGLVPNHLYSHDMTYQSGSTFFDSAFNHRNPGGSSGNNRTITLRFYGPVFQNDSDPAIKIEQDLGSWVDVTNRGVITFGSAAGGNPREITIHGTDGTTGKIPFLSGTYRIKPVEGELKCQGTSASPAPDVYDFTYSFTLDDDCNKNNVADATDLAETVTYGGDTYHPYDLDENQHIDVCDREANGTCVADIDGNGYINGDDYDWFAMLFEIAHPLADITFDGFVNGDDYDLFSGQFENGCP